MTEEKNWIELHRHFTTQRSSQGGKAWETIKLNTILCSALTSLTVYSLIYLYTSEFFWSTNTLTLDEKFWVRAGLISVPIVMFFINLLCYRNFRRQCKRMYELMSVVIKIEEKMNLYVKRPDKRDQFKNDEWYVPDEWKNLNFPKSKDYVNNCMKEKDRFYRHMMFLFGIFGVISIVFVIFEIGLLMQNIFLETLVGFKEPLLYFSVTAIIFYILYQRGTFGRIGGIQYYLLVVVGTIFPFIDVIETWIGFEHEGNQLVKNMINQYGWLPFTLLHLLLSILVLYAGWRGKPKDEVGWRCALSFVTIFLVILITMNAILLFSLILMR